MEVTPHMCGGRSPTNCARFERDRRGILAVKRSPNVVYANRRSGSALENRLELPVRIVRLRGEQISGEVLGPLLSGAGPKQRGAIRVL
jgi:hypothetical protein